MSQTAAAPQATGTIASHKIQPRHLARSAVVYVRQSMVQQILRHQESMKIQYRLADLAERLGWIEERVVVIDDDLGVSGASSEGRAGSQRPLADACHDGILVMRFVASDRRLLCSATYHVAMPDDDPPGNRVPASLDAAERIPSPAGQLPLRLLRGSAKLVQPSKSAPGCPTDRLPLWT